MSKQAIITGASGGIGKELAITMAKDGWNLILVARRKDFLASLKKDLESKYGVIVSAIAMDLAKPGAGKKLFSETQKNSKSEPAIDALINNAGFGLGGSFLSLDSQKQCEMINLNIRVLTELTHLYLPQIKKSPHGLLINVASIVGFQPGPYMNVYYATKAYVLHFTEALAVELKQKHKNVKISALCPGPTATDFFSNAGMEKSKLSGARMAILMSAKKVAQIGYKKALKGKVVVIPGFFNSLLVSLVKLSPRFFTRHLAGQLNRRMGA